MAIIRSPRSQRYTTLNNEVIEDVRLSWAALGMLTYLLSKPDNWRVVVSHLIADRSLGRDGVYRLLKELEDCGYVRKHQVKNEVGRIIGTEWHVYETPHPDLPDPENPDVGPIQANSDSRPRPENPDMGNAPHPDLPDPENPTLVITENTTRTDIGGGGGRARAREAQAQQEQQRKQTGTDPTEPTTAFAALREELSRHGWNLHRVLAGDTAQHIRQWAAMGVTADDIRDAITEATTDRKGQRKPLPNTPQYLTPILARIVEARNTKPPANVVTACQGLGSSHSRGSHHEANQRTYQSAVSRQEEAARRYRERRQAEGAYDEPDGNVIEGQFRHVQG